MDASWIWLTIGLALLGVELLSGTFIFLFFGIGGVVTALFAISGVNNPQVQVIIFSVVSLVTLFLFRKRFLKKTESVSEDKLATDVHKTLVLSQAIPAGAQGTVEYQGTYWTVVNISGLDLEQGTLAQIVRVEGIKLFITKTSGMENLTWKASQ